MGKKRVIMVDLDGTLCDHNHRLKLIDYSKSGSERWDEYHDAMELDSANEKLLSHLGCLQSEFEIVIATARPERYMIRTREWLDVHAPRLNPISILSRSDTDMRSSPELKKWFVDDINDKGFSIAMAFDDREDVCEMYESIGILAHKISSSDYVSTPQSPDEILLEGSKFFKDRNDKYGSAYLNLGKAMAGHFPDGIKLEGEQDFLRFQIFMIDVMKNNRISAAMAMGNDHVDSWHDKMIYAAMAKSIILSDKNGE